MDVQSVVAQSVLQVAQQLEQQVDQELHKLDNLQDDDIEGLRQKRLYQLKRQQEKQREWAEKGHGEYKDLNTEKDFFREMKGEERMVCHFYRESFPCKVMDKHISILTKQHMETKFVKINAEQSPYLTDKLKIWMLPTLALVKNEKIVDYVVGFDELGGKEDFTTDMLAMRLGAAGIINYEEPSQFAKQKQQQQGRSVRKGLYLNTGSDEDSDFDD